MSQRIDHMDWNHLRAFLATAEQGSLSAAARHLNLTQPTLGRQVSALEADLGVMLFERVGRSLELTGAGTELLQHVQQMGEAAHRAALTASGQVQSIDGMVRISASDLLSAAILPRAMRELRLRAPNLTIDLLSANNVSDLMRREADIAIRHMRPTQPDLIARKVRDATARIYASRQYLDQIGRVTQLSDMDRYDFICFDEPERMIGFLEPYGFPIDPAKFKLGSTDGNVAWALVREGLGICVMMDDIAANDPDMECILPEMEPIEFPVWLVTHRELHTSRRIRLVFDLLADMLAKPKLV